MTKSELAQEMGVSLPTIDAWVRRGCPVAERGGRGKSWRFELKEVSRWRTGRAGRTRLTPRQRSAAESLEFGFERRDRRCATGSAQLLAETMGWSWEDIEVLIRFGLPFIKAGDARGQRWLFSLPHCWRFVGILSGHIDADFKALPAVLEAASTSADLPTGFKPFSGTDPGS